MLKVLIIIAACIQVNLFSEINIDKCINGAIVSTECGYKINFNNVGKKSLDCILKFTSTNSTVKFINNEINVKPEEANKCPIIDLNIITMVNGAIKNNKISTTCGGTIEKLERDFSDFSLFVIKLDTKGLDDQVTKVNMSLEILGYKNCNLNIDHKESGYDWITRNYWIIIIFVVVIILVIFVVLCLKQEHMCYRKLKYLCCRIRNQLNVPQTSSENQAQNEILTELLIEKPA